MTGRAYLGVLLPVTSSWAVAPMAGQFALRGQSGAPRRLSAPVFLNGGGGGGGQSVQPLASDGCNAVLHAPTCSSRVVTPAATPCQAGNQQGLAALLPCSTLFICEDGGVQSQVPEGV